MGKNKKGAKKSEGKIPFKNLCLASQTIIKEQVVNAVRNGQSIKEASDLVTVTVPSKTVRHWIDSDPMTSSEKGNESGPKEPLVLNEIKKVKEWVSLKKPKDFDIKATFWTYDAIRVLIERKFSKQIPEYRIKQKFSNLDRGQRPLPKRFSKQYSFLKGSAKKSS